MKKFDIPSGAAARKQKAMIMAGGMTPCDWLGRFRQSRVR